MMTVKRANSRTAWGTHLQGHINSGYLELVKAFGEPGEGDGYKVDAEWVLDTPAGPATVYNYKDGKNYGEEDGLEVEDIRDWHIGGHTKDVVRYVQKALKENSVARDPELEYRLENDYTYHPPTPQKVEQHQEIRSAAHDLARLLVDSVPQGRELSTALTKLDEVVFWSNAGIARSK